MISSLTTVRLWSQQAALNAFKETSDSGPAAQPTRTLADTLHTDDGGDDGYEDTDLSALIAALQKQAMGATTPDPVETDGSVGDMSSKAFMKALEDKLEQIKANPDTKAMAETMLEALKEGTLTVTDAAAGERIRAWDISDEKHTAPEKTSVKTDDWSSFLKEHLARDNSGRYLRNPDSSHQDKTTGGSSYFGMIGDTHHYLSWTKPSDGTVSIQI